jgi:hypothetical protein
MGPSRSRIHDQRREQPGRHIGTSHAPPGVRSIGVDAAAIALAIASFAILLALIYGIERI